MNQFKIFAIAFLGTITISNAQDTDAAKKAIDAEQFEKAKSLLKTLIQTKPTNGEASYLLGNIYLYQSVLDSAKASFNQGLLAKDFKHYNYIGLGQMDLDAGNTAAANTNFDQAMKAARKKDTQEIVYIGRAYLSITKPDFKKAIEVLLKAKAINYNDAQTNLALGDAYYGDRNQNESYSSYRNAIAADASLTRAKMQQGVLLKGARAFDTATKELNNVVNESPAYGPVYRELAETYYFWSANDAAKREEYIKKALDYYEKYMSLTDYSLNSRMRHADFLILTKDYVALEAEANKMKQLDKVNPRILRYLGYSAFQNGNLDVAIKSLNEYIANPDTKKIAKDYFYLGLSKLKKATAADGKVADQTTFDLGVADIKSAVALEPKVADDINEIGSGLFKQKLYGPAASIFEIATSNKESKNYLMDNFYLGHSIYYGMDKAALDVAKLDKADLAYSNVIAAAPKTQDAYYFKAKVNSLLEKDDVMAANYQSYIDVVTAKGAEEMAKSKSKFIESYNNIGAFYANTDKVKAKEMWNNTLLLDPANTYASESIKNLK
jgi:predicted Zn-dependent protease